MKLVNIGFGNAVNSDRIVAVVSPEAAPVKRIAFASVIPKKVPNILIRPIHDGIDHGRCCSVTLFHHSSALCVIGIKNDST